MPIDHASTHKLYAFLFSRNERVLNRSLRKEQDQEYIKSLETDKLKMEQKKQEEDAKREAEQQQQQRENEKQRKIDVSFFCFPL